MIALGEQQQSSSINPTGQGGKEFPVTVGNVQQLPNALVVVRFKAKSFLPPGDCLSQLASILHHAELPKESAPLLEILLPDRAMKDSREIERVAIDEE